MVFPAAHVTTPASTDVNNGTAITTGVRFTVDATKSCDGVAFYVPGTNTGTYTVGLYETTAAGGPGGTGTLLASASVSAASVTAGSWGRGTFTPQSLTTGKVYTAAVHSSSGRIVATGAGLNSAITGNGVTLLASGTDPNPPGLGSMVNGIFNEGASLAYPTDTFNNTDYFPDLSIVTGQSAAAGTTSETDTAGTLGRAKARVVGIASGTDTAGSLARSKTRLLGVAEDVSTAPALGDAKARTLGVAAESTTALVLAHSFARALSVAAETDAAGVLGKVLGLGVAAETDTAGVLTVGSTASAVLPTMSVVMGPLRVSVVTGGYQLKVVSDA